MNQSRTIYFLDIDNQDLYFFKHGIERLGHRISIFRDGNKMIEDLHKSETKPDVFFLGSNMPMVNGKELLSILKNSDNWKDIPVVVVASAFPKKLLRYYMNAGVSHIMKRTNLADYSTSFKNVLEMRFA